MADKPLSREEKLEFISTVENKSTRQVKQELIQQSHQPALLAEKFQLPSVKLSTALTKFETMMTDENAELLQEFKNLYAHDLADHSNHSVLLFLLNKAVHHKKKKLGLLEKSPRQSNAPLPSAEDVKIEKQRKAIPTTVQRQIWKRANACCEYLDTKLKARCTSKFALETDHIISLALGGSNTVENLQLLCRSHNSRRAIKTFGVR
ncbi:HNH endonuclease [compost metagenome]